MSPALTPEQLLVVEQVADELARAHSVLFITGAGMSADSGLPTYRGIGGLYEESHTAEGLSIEEALSGPTLRRDPAITWRYLRQIEEAARGAGFNRGHEVIAEIEQALGRVVVLTQNVDHFHEAAGTRNVIDIHGNIRTLRCTSVGCGWVQALDDFSTLPPLPRCPRCAAPVRPDVVLFGEQLPEPKLARLRRELAYGFDLVFTIGTTSVFPYIASPVVGAARWGHPTVEINPGTSAVSELVRYRLQAGAAVALDAIWARARRKLPGRRRWWGLRRTKP